MRAWIIILAVLPHSLYALDVKHVAGAGIGTSVCTAVVNGAIRAPYKWPVRIACAGMVFLGGLAFEAMDANGGPLNTEDVVSNGVGSAVGVGLAVSFDF